MEPDDNNKSEALKFDKRFKEYQVCLQQIEKLEANIWQTAGLLSIGSPASFILLLGKDGQRAPLTTIVLVAVFVIMASLVWLRFVNRWSSIQHIKIDRVIELEKEMEFQQNRRVGEIDIAFQKYLLHLKENGRFFEKCWIILRYGLDDKKVGKEPGERKDRKNYEVRGYRSVIELLVATNVILWSAFALYAAYEKGFFYWVLLVLLLSFGLYICCSRRL